MGIRFNAAGERISRSGITSGAFTMMCWMKCVTARNNQWANILQPNDWQEVALTGANGNVLTIWDGAERTGSALTVGNWYHVTLTTANITTYSVGNTKVYLNGIVDISATGNGSTSGLQCFGDYSSGSYFNGVIAYVKTWNAELSQAEVQREMYSILPRRFSNLVSFAPTFSGSGERTRDYSGNGNNWTENGTLTDEDAPPISWGGFTSLVLSVPTSASHDLVAVSIATGSPTIGSPSIGQKHILNVSVLITGIPSNGSPVVGQKHVLTSTSITSGNPVVESPTIFGINALSVSNITTGSPVVQSASIGQKHSLSASGITSGNPIIGQPSIGQKHNITSGEIVAGNPVISTPTLSTGAFNLSANSIVTDNPIITSPVIGQTHHLSLSGVVTSNPVIGLPSLSQAAFLTATSIITGLPTIGQPTISQSAHLLSVNITTSIPLVGSPSISQVHNLAASEIVAGTPVIDSPSAIYDFTDTITASIQSEKIGVYNSEGIDTIPSQTIRSV